jgi:hypothetical protein
VESTRGNVKVPHAVLDEAGAQVEGVRHEDAAKDCA